MDIEGEWRKKLNECETSLQRLCEQARADDSPGRLSDVGAMVVRFERELLEEVRVREGTKVARWVRSPLRDVLLHLEGALCEMAGFFQWTAAGLRIRLRRPLGR
jgi:hypothetical protein